VPVATDARSASREAPPFEARSLLRHLRPYLIGATVLPVAAALYWGRGVLIPVALSRAKRDRDAQQVSVEEVHSVYQAGRETVEKLSARRHEASEEGTTIESTAVEEAPLVLGCPAADEGDEVALLMFGQLLKPTDCTLEIVPASALSGEIVSLVSERKPAVVVIGAVPPEGLAQGRYLCKRLRARFPELKVIVGRWGEFPGESDRASLLEAGADAVASTFAQSRDQLLERVHLV